MIWILLQKYFSPNLQQHMSKKTQFSSCQKSSFIISVRAMTKLCREKWVSAVEKMTNYKVSHLLTFWQANANWNVKTSVNYLASLRSDEVFFLKFLNLSKFILFNFSATLTILNLHRPAIILFSVSLIWRYLE